MALREIRGFCLQGTIPFCCHVHEGRDSGRRGRVRRIRGGQHIIAAVPAVCIAHGGVVAVDGDSAVCPDQHRVRNLPGKL